jgi:excisionase family DNA binding protein
MATSLNYSTYYTTGSAFTLYGITSGFNPGDPQPYWVRVDWEPTRYFYSGRVADDFAHHATLAKVLAKFFSCLTLTPTPPPDPVAREADRMLSEAQYYFDYLALCWADGDPERKGSLSRSQQCELKRRERAAAQALDRYGITAHLARQKTASNGNGHRPHAPETRQGKATDGYTPGRLIFVGKETYISTTEAAKRLHVTPRYVRTLIDKGILKGEKIGRNYIVAVSSLDRARERNTKRGPKPGSK